MNTVACPTRQAAFEDLDEIEAFVDSELERSEEAKNVIAESVKSPERSDAGIDDEGTDAEL